MVTTTKILNDLEDLEDKWFDAPWGLVSWEPEVIGKRLVTGELVKEDVDLYVKLSDVIDIVKRRGGNK